MRARATGDVLHFFLNCMRVLWERFDWILPIFLKSYFWCVMNARATGDVLHFFLNCMRVLWERFDWILPIFLKSYFILKSGSAAGIIEESRKAKHTPSPALSEYRVGGCNPARNVDYLGWHDASLWAGRQISKCTVQSIPHCYQD
jgi:hypothetical protein